MLKPQNRDVIVKAIATIRARSSTRGEKLIYMSDLHAGNVARHGLRTINYDATATSCLHEVVFVRHGKNIHSQDSPFVETALFSFHTESSGTR